MCTVCINVFVQRHMSTHTHACSYLYKIYHLTDMPWYNVCEGFKFFTVLNSNHLQDNMISITR